MNAPTEQKELGEIHNLEVLANKLGISLSTDDEKARRLTLLRRALISRAWGKRYRMRSNMDLEWLGDAIWRHAIVEEVLASQPHKKDVLHVESWCYTLTCGEEQYYLARELGLDALAKIPDGYTPTKGLHKIETTRVIIGSALEAVLGAIAHWGRREAIECARRLVRERMKDRPFIKRRDVVNGADNGRYLDISSREQLLGFTRLNVFVTYELTLMEEVLTTGAYVVRQTMLSTHGLALMGRAVHATVEGNTDVQAMQRLLTRAGKGRKLDEELKHEMRARLRICAHELETYERNRQQPNKVRTPQTPVLGQLKALSQAHGLNLETLSRVRGGGNSREVVVTHRINGQKIAEAAGKTYVEAAEKAAAETLTSPLFEKLLQP